MNDHPRTAPPAPGDPLTALATQYPEWQLRPAPPGIAAEHTSADGRHIRYIAARRVDELAAKLATAEAATASGDTGLRIEPSGHNSWRVAGSSGNVAATIKWSGEYQMVCGPVGRPLGTLWRSDGRLVSDADGQQEVTYTWRAYRPDTWTGDVRYAGAEVARHASHEDAIAALLATGDCHSER